MRPAQGVQLNPTGAVEYAKATRSNPSFRTWRARTDVHKGGERYGDQHSTLSQSSKNPRAKQPAGLSPSASA